MRSAQGSVVELEKGRLYRVFVEGRRDWETGKRSRMSRTVRGSRRDAEAEKARMLLEIGEVPDRRMTLDEFADTVYFPYVSERLRPDTVFGYRKKYTLYIQERLGCSLLDDITPAAVNALLLSIDGGNKRLVAYKQLRQMLSRAVRMDMLRSNPCDRIEVPKVPRYEPEVLTAKEARAYMEHFQGSPVEAAVLVAIGCGLRRSEICALDWDDVRDGRITVDNAITTVGGAAHDDAPKSAFSTRVVNVPRSVMERLEELRSEGPMLQTADGGRMHPERISKLYAEGVKTLPDGVKRTPLKNLRHTSLTLALEGGADLLAVSRRAGHSGVGITARYYLRPSDEVDKAAASALDSLL